MQIEKHWHWTVLGRRGSQWWGRCDCGTERAIYIADVRAGRSKSCGCMRGSFVSASKARHGHAHVGRVTPEYRIWGNMKSRCYNERTTFYADYGGRGIAVCDRWRESFEAFVADMGLRPSSRHEIDRIDNDGPYSPENCRWATRTTQARNCRKNRMLTAFGETRCLSEWAELTGLGEGTIAWRVKRGATPEQAMSPHKTRAPRIIHAHGLSLCIAEWARRMGVQRYELERRLARSADPASVLTA